jgi:hypothetical protein
MEAGPFHGQCTPRTLSNGNNTSGSMEVTASGAASVIHHTAIHNTTATTCLAAPSSDPVGTISMKTQSAGPSNRPTVAGVNLSEFLIRDLVHPEI